MDPNTKHRLDNYLELLDEISEKTSDEKTALALLQEISKDRRMEQIRDEREGNGLQPATEKQKRFMDDLEIKYPKKVTKQEASVLIDEELQKNGE